MVTQVMKTHILGSATARHESSSNWTSVLEFFKLSLFWQYLNRNNKYTMAKTYQKIQDVQFSYFHYCSLPFLPESLKDLYDRFWDFCIKVWPPPPPGSKIMTGLKLFSSYKLGRRNDRASGRFAQPRVNKKA